MVPDILQLPWPGDTLISPLLMLLGRLAICGPDNELQAALRSVCHTVCLSTWQITKSARDLPAHHQRSSRIPHPSLARSGYAATTRPALHAPMASTDGASPTPSVHAWYTQ